MNSAPNKTSVVIGMFQQESYGFNGFPFSNRAVFRVFSPSFIAGPLGKETVVGELKQEKLSEDERLEKTMEKKFDNYLLFLPCPTEYFVCLHTNVTNVNLA